MLNGPNVNAPDEVREVFDLLSQETYGILHKTEYFQTLFMSNPSHIDLMNEYAVGFFSIFQGLLLDEIILAICRLLDRKSTGGQDNLTISQLIGTMNGPSDSMLIQSMNSELDATKSSLKTLRARRHKHLAHKSLPHARRLESIPPIYWKEIESCLETVKKCLNHVERHFGAYVDDFNIVTLDDPKDILGVLYRVKSLDES